MNEMIKKPAFWITIAVVGVIAYAVWQKSEKKAEETKAAATTPPASN